MSLIRTIPVGITLLLAVASADGVLTPNSYGQTGVPEGDAATLRSELSEVAQLLRAQQAEIRRQTFRIEQLERDRNGGRLHVAPAPQPVDRLPATPVSSSMTAFDSYEAMEPAPGCGEVTCDPGAPCGACDPGVSGRAGKRRPQIDVGGQYRVMFNGSNFDFHPATLNNAQPSQTFFNQRFRTWLTVRPNRHVEGHLEVEMGHIGWGENAFDFPKVYNGPRFPGALDPTGDRVGVELRKGYLGYQSECLGRMRAGIQGWQDSFGQTLASSDWDFDVGGLSWVRAFPAFGDMGMQFGVFALEEGDTHLSDDAVFLAVDLDWVRTDEHSLGFSAYYLPDSGTYSYPTAAPYHSAWDVWLGVRASTRLWSLPVHAFAIYNTGERRDFGGVPTFQHDDAGLKLEIGPLPMGIGALSFQTLYSTGDDNPDENQRDGFRTVAQSVRDNFGSQGYWSYLVLTSPHGPSDVNDLGVSLQNRGLGLFTLQGKYDYPICNRLSGTLAAGWLRSDARNPVSGGHELGTELANIFTLDFGGGLVADFGASVLFTGDFYQTGPAAPRPDDLWEVFTRLQLEF